MLNITVKLRYITVKILVKITINKDVPPGQITFWKYNGKSIFSLFLNTDQNGPNFFLEQ